MYLFDLGELPWKQSMLIFHTLARLGIEALIIVSPRTPFISIGYFQDAQQEINFEYCRQKGLPIFRREVGGGTVYLDRNQIFTILFGTKIIQSSLKESMISISICRYPLLKPMMNLVSLHNFVKSMIL